MFKASPQPQKAVTSLATDQPDHVADGTRSHAFRASLLEKHAKHIDDLHKYYEMEIASLKDKLGSNSPGKSGPHEKSASHGIVLAKLESMELENKRLKTRCSNLEGQLDDSIK